MDVISRKQAKAAGLVRYFTGVPCKHGHIAERYTGDGVCSECAIVKLRTRYAEDPNKARARVAEWARNNADARAAYMAEWRKRNKDLVAIHNATYRATHRRVLADKQRVWRGANIDAARQTVRAAMLKNRVGRSMRVRKWAYLHPSQHNGYKRVRDARIRVATPGWADKLAIRRFYAACPPGYVVDHIVPVQGKYVCGLHCVDNMQYLKRADNLAKGNRHGDFT